MNEHELRTLLQRHNQAELAWGITYSILGVFLWIISYLIALWLGFTLLALFVPSIANAWLANLVAVMFMGVLVLDGIRYTGELFDLIRFNDSFYNIGRDRAGRSLVPGARNPLTLAFFISQILLSAPRSSISAVRHLKNLAVVDDAMLHDAVVCFDRLGSDASWQDVDSFGETAVSLRYLVLTELVWIRVEDDEPQVKISPSAKIQYVEQRLLGKLKSKLP